MKVGTICKDHAFLCISRPGLIVTGLQTTVLEPPCWICHVRELEEEVKRLKALLRKQKKTERR